MFVLRYGTVALGDHTLKLIAGPPYVGKFSGHWCRGPPINKNPVFDPKLRPLRRDSPYWCPGLFYHYLVKCLSSRPDNLGTKHSRGWKTSNNGHEPAIVRCGTRHDSLNFDDERTNERTNFVEMSKIQKIWKQQPHFNITLGTNPCIRILGHVTGRMWDLPQNK